VRLLGPQHPVHHHRVLDDDLGRVDDSDEVRQQLGAAPAGDQAERHLGQGERRGAAGDGPVVAVQRQLQPAAHGRAVDERERGHAGVAQLGEDLVAVAADLQRLLA